MIYTIRTAKVYKRGLNWSFKMARKEFLVLKATYEGYFRMKRNKKKKEKKEKRKKQRNKEEKGKKKSYTKVTFPKVIKLRKRAPNTKTPVGINKIPFTQFASTGLQPTLLRKPFCPLTLKRTMAMMGKPHPAM